jgi:3-hydroxyisobutyrate dehydrogenase-like beta-hydroxyacid dehydrogenase
MTATSHRVSVLGLGLMGSALAEALLNAGHQVTVWNRSPAKAKALIGKGAQPAATAAAAIAASDLTIICVTNHDAAMEILNGIPASGEAGTLVQLSTMTADESRELAAWSEVRSIAYLDGSILGIPTNVSNGSATVIFSGPPGLFEANCPLFRALGSPLHLSPEIGASVTFDRVWYAYSFSVMMAFMQGAAMTEALGFSLEVYFETVKARTPLFLDPMMKYGNRITTRDYATEDARIEVWADCFEETLALCREKGVDAGLPAAVMANLRRACVAGHGDDDLAAVFEVLIAGDGG